MPGCTPYQLHPWAFAWTVTLPDVTGKVCNQAPDSFLEADKSLTLDTGSGAVDKSSAEIEKTLARSQCELGPEGCWFITTFGTLSDGKIPNGEW